MFHLTTSPFHLSPYLDNPFAADPSRRGGALAQRQSSMFDRELPGMNMLQGMNMLPGMNMMGNMLEGLPRSLGEMMKIETSADQAVHVCFEDMGDFDQHQIDYNKAMGTLTVSGTKTSANHSASASRTISLPCEVIKPELVTAETRGGRVVVTIPREAQSLKLQSTMPALLGGQPKALKVNIVGKGEERAAMSP
jgi:hypothetical protein